MKSQRHLSLIAVAVLSGTAVAFQNCSDTSFQRQLQRPQQNLQIDESPAIRIFSVDPSSAVSETVTPVNLLGENFSNSTRVFFGGQECQGVSVLSENQLTCTLDAVAGALGFVDVQASALDREPGLLPQGFEWTMTIAQKCASPNHRTTQTLNIAIPAQNQQCPFGQGDNMGLGGGRVSARVEQTQKINIPENSAICNMQFQFLNQQFRYDDMFLLTFNDVILVSSYADVVSALPPSADGLLSYAWTGGIAGRNWSGDNTPYCLGVSSGMGSCTIPVTEQTQTMSLNINADLITKISERQVNASENQFKMITVGDDNPGVDCMHSGLNFNVNVTYVSK